MTRAMAIWCVAAGLLLGLAARSAQAQSFGVKGGLNLSTIAVDPKGELGEVTAKAGVTAGGFLTFKETSRLSFEVAGLLSMRRIDFGPIISDRITYLEAAVVARYPVMTRSGLIVRAVGGIVPAFRLAASESVAGDSASATDAYKAVDIAVTFGAQAEWKKKWTFEARYLFGVSDVYAVTLGSEQTRQRGLQVLVGYRLR